MKKPLLKPWKARIKEIHKEACGQLFVKEQDTLFVTECAESTPSYKAPGNAWGKM